jgi:hypothetical protein
MLVWMRHRASCMAQIHAIFELGVFSNKQFETMIRLLHADFDSLVRTAQLRLIRAEQHLRLSEHKVLLL